MFLGRPGRHTSVTMPSAGLKFLQGSGSIGDPRSMNLIVSKVIKELFVSAIAHLQYCEVNL